MDMMWYRRRGLMVTPHIESVTGAIASFNSDYNKIPIKSLICDIEPIQEGSGDPNPENIRPISGRTGLSMTRCGKNLLQQTTESPVSKNGITAVKNADGTITTTGTATTQYTHNIGHVLLAPGAYTISGCPAGGTNSTYRIRVGIDAYNGTLIATDIGEGAALTLTEQTDVYIRLYIQPASGEVNLTWKPMISVDGSEYEPYHGETVSVNWETEAGTVYGGYVDVVSGKLVVDRAIVNLGTLTWMKITTSGDHWRFWTILNTMRLPSQMISSQYTQIGATEQYMGAQGIANQASGSNVLAMVSDERYADADAFKADMSGVYLVYELATPLTYQLTPQEIKTLLVNNIWCDSGDVSVNYWKWGK